MTNKKPPVGLFPYRLWVEERAQHISAAIERYTSAGCSVPPKWLYELMHHGKYPDIESITSHERQGDASNTNNSSGRRRMRGQR